MWMSNPGNIYILLVLDYYMKNVFGLLILSSDMISTCMMHNTTVHLVSTTLMVYLSTFIRCSYTSIIYFCSSDLIDSFSSQGQHTFNGAGWVVERDILS